jgi:putative salt-induced outer membrane protein YdiY
MMKSKDSATKQPAGYGYGSNAKVPAGVAAQDKSGTRSERMVNGVGMGEADMTGKDKQFNTGVTPGVCYTHDRMSHQK